MFPCLQNVSNYPSSHSVGNARPLQIQQRHLDHCPRILDHPAATLEDARVVAEIQLHLITSKIQCNPLLMQTSDVEFEELERWKMKWAHLLGMIPPPAI